GASASGERRQRRVVAHRGRRLVAVSTGAPKQEVEVLLRVTSGGLAPEQRLGRRSYRNPAGGGLNGCTQPASVGSPSREASLDGSVLLESGAGGVDDEDLAGAELAAPNLQAARQRHRSRLRRAGDESVLRDGVAKGAQAVSVEHGTDDAPVGEDDRGR